MCNTDWLADVYSRAGRERWLSANEDVEPQPAAAAAAAASPPRRAEDPTSPPPPPQRIGLASSPSRHRGAGPPGAGREGLINPKLLLNDPPPVELLPDHVLTSILDGRKVGLAEPSARKDYDALLHCYISIYSA